MKKILPAVAASLLILGGQVGVDAAPVQNPNVASVATQDASSWTRFRDKVLGRDDKRYRNDWNHRHDYRDDHRNSRRENYPPPPPPSHRR